MARPMDIETSVIEALQRVEDPEIPVTLADLGVLQDVTVCENRVVVEMLPTRLGCPGIYEMERRVREAVASVDADLVTRIDWKMQSWTPEMVSQDGKSTLEEIGYILAGGVSVECPYCGSPDASPAGSFGASLCKVPYACNSCGSQFDALRSALATPHDYETPERRRTVAHDH